MKTITKNNLSLYIVEDGANVVIESDKITVNNPRKFIISDLNSGNAVLHDGVIPPNDWIGGKYNYDGTNWSLA
tara:strand:- start:47 stop:265 length:219 start_codon:yes stop_codon:yes gene_type:complete